jgi:hypothetical protein
MRIPIKNSSKHLHVHTTQREYVGGQTTSLLQYDFLRSIRSRKWCQAISLRVRDGWIEPRGPEVSQIDLERVSTVDGGMSDIVNQYVLRLDIHVFDRK